jgi:hypothetical protein
MRVLDAHHGKVLGGRPFRYFACGVCAALLGASGARAQCETFGPMTPGVRVSQSQLYNQIWSQVTRTNNGWAFAWTEGQNIAWRRYDANMQPLGPDVPVNTTLNQETQDEPAIATATNGNVMIAWSDRYGYDGEQMGCYARVFNAAGAPLGPEFAVNQVWQASQWRPLIAPMPNGNFVCAWSGDWDGDAFIRIFSAAGVPLTGDIVVNQFMNDAQVDPAVAVNADGIITVAFVDFSSHGSVGSGLNLYLRRFDLSGAPLADEVPATTWASNGDQRNPRIAVDGLGRFVVTWASEQVDGSGYAIMARRFGSHGAPSGPEFQVNTTAFGNQTLPNIVCETGGDFVIAWEDDSTGVQRIALRRFGADLQPRGPEAFVDDPTSGADMPVLAQTPDGSTLILAYETFGGPDYDVMGRMFQTSLGPQIFCSGKVNSAGCTPSIGFVGVPSASSPTPFLITAASILNQRPGLLFYGYSSAFTPFQGGTLCAQVASRTPAQFSGGTQTGINCTGTFSFDFNALTQSGVNPQLTPGRTISAQYYYRDAQDPAGFGSGLTNALRFTICP